MTDPEAKQEVAARQLLALVAHDLRTPLTILDGAAQMLAAHDLDREERALVDQVLRAARRMGALIRDLVDAASIEAGRLAPSVTVTRSACAAAALVGDAQDSLRPLAVARPVRLETRVEDGATRVSCERARVLQVFENLVGNAVRFTPPGGVVTLACRLVEGAVRFEVRDTGDGVPPAVRPRLFERHFAAGGAGKRGTGLGLSIARRIVEAHGGRIWHEALPDGGSCFAFTLPLAPGG